MLSQWLFMAAILLGPIAAQVSTDCNPMEADNCPPDPAFGADHLFVFNNTPSSELWEVTAGTVRYDPRTGASFTINKQGDSPTLRTKFYFFFGRTELWLKAAPGTGIISSMMWLSDNLDEVDWEFLGSNKSFASTNYFGKGREDFANGGWHSMSGMQDTYHNYTTVWTKDQINWFIDGGLVRTLKASEANDTNNYPQTPMRMSVGIWAGGDPSLPEGTRKWAGGDTNYGAGPYTMYLQQARITDFSSGKEYTFGDKSGSWQSIKITDGNSTALQALLRGPEKSFSEKWNELPSSTKTIVYVVGAVVLAIALGALIFYFIKQRRLGVQEAKIAEEKAEAERLELEQFTRAGINPDSLPGYAPAADFETGSLQKDILNDADSYHIPESPASPLNGAAWDQSMTGTGLAAAAMPSSQSNLNSDAQISGVTYSAANSSSTGPAQSSSIYHQPGRGQDPELSRPHTPMLRLQSPGLPPQIPLPSPVSKSRSASASYAQPRNGTPGPHQGNRLPRVQSPGFGQSMRSFSDSRQDQRGDYDKL